MKSNNFENIFLDLLLWSSIQFLDQHIMHTTLLRPCACVYAASLRRGKSWNALILGCLKHGFIRGPSDNEGAEYSSGRGVGWVFEIQSKRRRRSAHSICFVIKTLTRDRPWWDSWGIYSGLPGIRNKKKNIGTPSLDLEIY